MIFDTPGLAFMVFLSIYGPLTAVGILRALYFWKTPHGWDAVYFYTTLIGAILGVLLVISAWVSRMYDEYIRNRDEPMRPKPVEENKPRIYADGKALYSQELEYPVLNYERHFAECVLRQYDMNQETQEHVNMTETLWVKKKRMFTQKPFMAMKENWVRHGLAMRKSHNKNSPYLVADRQRVEEVARGKALPH